jgi:hypothetical protein
MLTINGHHALPQPPASEIKQRLAILMDRNPDWARAISRRAKQRVKAIERADMRRHRKAVAAALNSYGTAA